MKNNLEYEIKRLGPTADTVRMLLLRSGNQCYFPDCEHVIFNDNDLLVAECCHIEAALPGGERFNPTQSEEERRAIDNLLFLCHKHHVETDDTSVYTVEKLKKIKQNHENKFRENQFYIGNKHVTQITSAFKQILSALLATSETVKQIDSKQDLIIDILTSKQKEEGNEIYYEYFGAPPVYSFFGRIDETDDLVNNFDIYNTFLIGGISGIGKTAFIANFLSKLQTFHFLWIDCETINNKELFFDSFSRFLKQEFQDYSIDKLLLSSNNSLIQSTIISCLQKYDCCIVFDGLNSPRHILYDLLIAFNKSLMHSKIIITTYYKFETAEFFNFVYSVVLKGLDKDSFCKLLQENKVFVGDKFIMDIYYLLDGHPYLLKLVVGILQYLPIESFLQQSKNKNFDEINDYVKNKILEVLNEEELNLLKKMSLFAIPFRYSIGEYISSEEFNILFKILKNRFLIESFQDVFFIIPEFIRNRFISDCRYIDNITCLQFINYILSLKSNVRYIEKNALIYFALRANMIDLAKREAKLFISSLMLEGKFNYASKVMDNLATEPHLKDWCLVYYVQGRVARFQGDFQYALEMYNKYIGLCKNNDEERESAEFEKASMLTYIAQESGDDGCFKDAVMIYERLRASGNKSMSFQCQAVLLMFKIKSGEYNETDIGELERLTKSLDVEDIEPNVTAQIWQILGDVYSERNKRQKAFECFDISIEFYKIAIDKYGMNVVDGLFHLYESYGWTYSKCRDYVNAVEMFKIRVDLCDNFELGKRKIKSLFDYGYHLILTYRFEDASEILIKHFSLVMQENLIEKEDMNLIYGSLSFAHWYNGDFENAVKLLGLYITVCYNKNIKPIICIIEEINMEGELDLMDFFRKKIYIFIIPSGYNHSDFERWINIVSNQRPDLREPLSSFHCFYK